jgi:hypothetical protein
MGLMIGADRSDCDIVCSWLSDYQPLADFDDELELDEVVEA